MGLFDVFKLKNAQQEIPKIKSEEIPIEDTVPKNINFQNIEKEELYEICKKYVIEKQKASISLLHRDFNIGYTLSCKIINNLEKEGIIGAQVGELPRKVLVKTYAKSNYVFVDDFLFNSKKANTLTSTFDEIKDGIQFEKYIANLLQEKGYSVQLTQKSNDFGADIIATRDNIKYAIQCKFYSSPVGISAIQEILGGKEYYSCNIAIVATNNVFTTQAIELATKSNVILWNGSYIEENFINYKEA